MNAGPLAPAGKNRMPCARRRKRLAVGAAHAELFPFGEARVALHRVEALRQHDLEAPGQAVLPVLLVQIIAGRGEHVGHVAPDVALAVAGKIDGVVDDVGRHELRLPHGAGPGADHLLARKCAVLHDAHGHDQLVAEIRIAVFDVSRASPASGTRPSGPSRRRSRFPCPTARSAPSARRRISSPPRRRSSPIPSP